MICPICGENMENPKFCGNCKAEFDSLEDGGEYADLIAAAGDGAEILRHAPCAAVRCEKANTFVVIKRLKNIPEKKYLLYNECPELFLRGEKQDGFFRQFETEFVPVQTAPVTARLADRFVKTAVELCRAAEKNGLDASAVISCGSYTDGADIKFEAFETAAKGRSENALAAIGRGLSSILERVREDMFAPPVNNYSEQSVKLYFKLLIVSTKLRRGLYGDTGALLADVNSDYSDEVEIESVTGMRLLGGTAAGIRGSNEDNIRIGLYGDALFMLVCDGMGGLDAGEYASAYCCNELTKLVKKGLQKNFRSLVSGDGDIVKEILKQSVRLVSDALYKSSKAKRTECGCTVAAALVFADRFYEVHAGDSRVYVLSGGDVKFVSEDHSPVADAVRAGRLTEEDSLLHPQRNLISSFVGECESDLVVSVAEGSLLAGDKVLLCSDGICGCFLNSEIADIAAGDFHESFYKLLSAAFERDSADNCSLIVYEHGAAGDTR